MSVFSYIFLSPDKKQRVPLTTQQESVGEFATSRELVVGELFIEEDAPSSVAFADRPEGKRLLELCLPGDTIITAKCEWVFNLVEDVQNLLNTLKEKNISFLVADLESDISLEEKRKLQVTTGQAVLIQKLVSALAENKAQASIEAIRTAKAAMKEQGRYVGGPVPFGWKVAPDGMLEKDGEQQKIIQIIIKMHKDRWSYRDIAEKLAKEHEITLSHTSVGRIIKRAEKN